MYFTKSQNSRCNEALCGCDNIDELIAQANDPASNKLFRKPTAAENFKHNVYSGQSDVEVMKRESVTPGIFQCRFNPLLSIRMFLSQFQNTCILIKINFYLPSRCDFGITRYSP